MRLTWLQRMLLGVALLALTSCAAGAGDGTRADGTASAQSQSADRSRAAFRDVARVLRHPRCLNCHTVTDFPRTGDEARPHRQNVRRGADGLGLPGLHCNSCHQETNQNIARVPGAPHWRLAPLSMGWEGLDDRALATVLKDPAKNGGRSLAALEKHLAEDPLVGWAWDPGPGRALPPSSRADFVARFREWIETGAVTP